MTDEKLQEFKKELQSLINCYSIENESNTPDFMLADYLIGCLQIFNLTLGKRDQWYRFNPWPERKIK